MARASSRLPALFLLYCFCSMSLSSIHVRFAGSLSLDDLPFSGPSAILVFPGAASVGGSPPKAGPPEAEPGSGNTSSGRVSSYAKEVLPLWGNLTGGGMASLITTGFCFQIIAHPSGSSCLAWMVPRVPGGQDHRFACFNPGHDARGSELIGDDDDGSTEYTGTTTWPGKNLSSVLLLYRVSYLAPHAAALHFSFNCSGPLYHPALSLLDSTMSLGINTTRTANCGWSVSDLSGRVPRYTRRRTQHAAIRRTRRLLSGTHGGRRATRAQHAAIRGKVKSKPSWSWLEQVSVAASALVGLTCAVAGLVLCCIRSKSPRQKPASIELEGDEHTVTQPELRRRGLGPSEFRYSELAVATDNFAAERKIGRGGFGPVYRGYLSEEDRHVAIKVLSRELSVQGLKEFQAEVCIMSQLRHRNIVRLVGWCGRRRELALVYELVPGGSLDKHLYNPDRHLTWPQRYKIALQLGSALRYLHTDCDQCVVHGDIKPANIMLDASLDAKLGDFGLARLVDHGAEPQTTQVVAGTVGYIDPEFVSSRRPCAESDVYSFGVVLLEIACGRRPTTPRRPDQAGSAALLASVRDMYRRNVVLEAADRRLDGEFDGAQMERLLVTGLWCAHHDPGQRPSVAQAVDVLRSEDAALPVLGTMGGSVDVRNWEGRAYGDLSAESSCYLDESTETEYLTTEQTAYLFPEEL